MRIEIKAVKEPYSKAMQGNAPSTKQKSIIDDLNVFASWCAVAACIGLLVLKIGNHRFLAVQHKAY
ncbi:MAG: hypothetical protein KME49_26730 [Brasilonema octagenarum HA4186-MV1]|jgi:hypothetical protein|nr:hypothetical protein [Brasilonema octagenarum HA4186-MV1]